MSTHEEVTAALQKLGVTGILNIQQHDSFTVTVFVDGKEFGLWDTVKKTFVE